MFNQAQNIQKMISGQNVDIVTKNHVFGMYSHRLWKFLKVLEAAGEHWNNIQRAIVVPRQVKGKFQVQNVKAVKFAIFLFAL